jgi:hypothetical protein
LEEEVLVPEFEEAVAAQGSGPIAEVQLEVFA